MAKHDRAFQAEVSKLLDIVIHSLYSEPEIFLRELISNAADACDKLRYMAITKPHLTEDGGDFGIWMIPNQKENTLVIADNGVGMNEDDLVNHLSTIAKSGTSAFVANMTGDAKKDMSLIGQFGVGFYSAFMVAEKVEVLTRKAGEDTGYKWTSDGVSGYQIEEADDVGRGTKITLHLKKDHDQYVNPTTLRQIVRTYSDHIALPVVLVGEKEDEKETINTASALWTRSKSDITEEQYKEFYHAVSHAFDDPWMTLHYKAEGAIEYTGLLYVPTEQPHDLFSPERKPRLKLYVRRVFITDDAETLLPSWLRFVRGVVDSQDLPLNVSREMLQNNPVLNKMRTGLVKRILSELKKKTGDADFYAKFWNAFGPVLKEGLYEDFQNREEIAKLCRFNCTGSDELISLEDYIAKMKDGQDAIYYITGEDLSRLKNNPQLEGFIARGVPVLLLTDPIDEFWPQTLPTYEDKRLISVIGAATDLDKFEAPEEKKEEEKDIDQAGIDKLLARLKDALANDVKDVRTSKRLTESPVCLVPADGEGSAYLEKLMRQHRMAVDAPKTAARVLEINPNHSLITHLAAKTEQDAQNGIADLSFNDTAALLLDQARVASGEPIPDPASFAKRMTALLTGSM